MLTAGFAAFACALPAVASPMQGSQEARGIRIPLHKRSALSLDDIADPSALTSALEHVLSCALISVASSTANPFLPRKYENGFAAYQMNTGEPHPLTVDLPDTGTNVTRRAVDGHEPLKDEDDGSLWQGSLTIGTPAKTFTVQFDTGSSDLFIPGPSCPSCRGHAVYNPSSSSTSVDVHKPFNLAFGSGAVRGEQYIDTVSVSGLTVRAKLYTQVLTCRLIAPRRPRSSESAQLRRTHQVSPSRIFLQTVSWGWPTNLSQIITLRLCSRR